MRLAFADTYTHVADPSAMTIDTDELLSPQRIASLAQRISLDEARYPETDVKAGGGITYLTAADRDRYDRLVYSVKWSWFWFGLGCSRRGDTVAKSRQRFSSQSSPPECLCTE
jgi:gamma-glutamyltranspeptidase / glutathione hydrolase